MQKCIFVRRKDEYMRILMSLMQLDIGGAETHVVELAKELKRRGHEVIITSNGGAYVAELENFGIEHYIVPLQNKNPKNVLCAFRLLKKIIEEKKPDVVHSHARIPSFILGKLHKKMKFPFLIQIMRLLMIPIGGDRALNLQFRLMLWMTRMLQEKNLSGLDCVDIN